MTETDKIIEILGGTKFVGKDSNQQQSLIPAIQRGFRFDTLVFLKGLYELPDDLAQKIIAVSTRTWARRKAENRLSPVESDRLYRLARIIARTEEVFGSREKARLWLKEPNRALRLQTPLSLLDTDEGTAACRGCIDSHRTWGLQLMELFRLCSSRYQATAFSGLGASLAGGRWNDRGESVVYLGGTLALAALECLVHFSHQTLPDDYVCLTVTVPKGIKIEIIDPTLLAPEWWDEDPPVTTQALGSAWLQRQSSLFLEVPSAIIPSEFNYLLNPQHKDFGKLHIAQPVAFRFDPRLKT